MFAVLTNSIRSQFDSKKGTDKRGSLVLRNSKIAIVGRVSINSDQINLILFLNLISYILAMLNSKSTWFGIIIR